MESSNKAVILNVAIGNWYPQGQKRLVKSLNFHGYPWDVKTWTNQFPLGGYDESNPYNAKAAAFEWALNEGYTHIAWLDCSVWAVKNVEPWFDVINNDGYYLGQSGYNCAQVCSDYSLNHFGVDRDKAETYQDCHTGVFGVYVENQTAREFITKWIDSAKAKAFNGSRLHDNQSQDQRFLFHRQDQACASVIAGQLGMKLHNFGQYVNYYPAYQDGAIFSLRGM